MNDYRTLDWMDFAECRGVDPAVFDDTNPETAVDTIDSFCAQCPAINMCLDRVKPESSYFDGIAGGKLWREGKEIDLLPLITVRKDPTD